MQHAARSMHACPACSPRYITRCPPSGTHQLAAPTRSSPVRDIEAHSPGIERSSHGMADITCPRGASGAAVTAARRHARPQKSEPTTRRLKRVAAGSTRPPRYAIVSPTCTPWRALVTPARRLATGAWARHSTRGRPKRPTAMDLPRRHVKRPTGDSSRNGARAPRPRPARPQDFRLRRAIRRLTFASSLWSTTQPRQVGAPHRQRMAESAGHP